MNQLKQILLTLGQEKNMNLTVKRITMMSLLLTSLLCSVCKAELSDISQSASFQLVTVGDSVTITCHLPHVTRVSFWCKVSTGNRLELVATTDTFYDLDNQKSDRLSVTYDEGSTSLMINETAREDVGLYFCVGVQIIDVYFGRGTFLMIQGVGMISDTVVQKPNSLSIQPGESVNISCCVHSVHCAADHTNVMWLKNSVHSAPEIIHSSGNETSTCQSTGSGETICEYDYLIQNLTSDDAGAYYCVATVCGHLLFGNGTRVQIHENPKSPNLSPVVIALILSNCVSVLVALLLVWRFCRKHEQSVVTALYRSGDESPEDNQLRSGAIYTTVTSIPSDMSRRTTQLTHHSDTVLYSDVRSRQ